jgi:putative transposase
MTRIGLVYGARGSTPISASRTASGCRPRAWSASCVRPASPAWCDRRRGRTTVSVPSVRVADDLVRQSPSGGAQHALDRRRDLPQGLGGWLYLAAVQDADSRWSVGRAMADHMRAELVVDALQTAVARPRPAAGVSHHADDGGQYVAVAFGQAARDAGIARSMGSKGDCGDNAVAESFFATLKKELVHRRSWPTPARARLRDVRVH